MRKRDVAGMVQSAVAAFLSEDWDNYAYENEPWVSGAWEPFTQAETDHSFSVFVDGERFTVTISKPRDQA